jgi:DNA-directed RNA polymerase specialized sigma24 family protein
MQSGTVITMTERQPSDVGEVKARADGLSPELLFSRHYRPLVAALALACGNQELAADCVEDAFVELCRRWSKVGSYEKPEAWLMRVAVNRARSEQRSLRRRAAALARTELSPPDDPIGVPAHLVRAFQSLPARQRLACSLFYVVDLPLEEVAHTMGISVGAAGAHLYRARNSMRSLLEETP